MLSLTVTVKLDSLATVETASQSDVLFNAPPITVENLGKYLEGSEVAGSDLKLAPLVVFPKLFLLMVTSASSTCSQPYVSASPSVSLALAVKTNAVFLGIV